MTLNGFTATKINFPAVAPKILPVKVSLTAGDYYTLWAPSWKEHGDIWQAFLGTDEHVCFFKSPAALLAWLEANDRHDLSTHPKWGEFREKPAHKVVPAEKQYYDLVGVPAMLAGRASHENVTGVDRAFQLAKSLGAVTTNVPVQSFFSGHSVLANVSRGADHYASEFGLSEWLAVGRVVLANWEKVLDNLDEQVFVPEVAESDIAAAQTRIDAATAQAAAKAEEEARAAKEAAEKVDPYDASVWGQAGIDPIKMAIDGRSLYTLRTYVSGTPVFLGRFGEIFTFNSPKALTRWLVEHDEHDLAKVSTWGEIMAAANDGSLEITVHPDNQYSFNGLADAIAKGPNEVDTDQLRRAYELLADSSDWAADDAVNAVLVANPALQEYISYMLGSTSGYVPSAPYTAEVEGWKQLEQGLVARFSKF